MARNPQTFSIVVESIDQRLTREGHEWAGHPRRRLPAEEELPPPQPDDDAAARRLVEVEPELRETVTRMTREFEERFVEAFDELGDQLDFDRATADQTFHGIISSTFQEGISWTRIVALLCLSGAMATKCVALGMPELVDDVAEWTVRYFDHHLHEWMSDHGGWEGFLHFYQNQDHVDGGWRGFSASRVLGYAAGLVGVLTIGAFLGQRA